MNDIVEEVQNNHKLIQNAVSSLLFYPRNSLHWSPFSRVIPWDLQALFVQLWLATEAFELYRGILQSFNTAIIYGGYACDVNQYVHTYFNWNNHFVPPQHTWHRVCVYSLTWRLLYVPQNSCQSDWWSPREQPLCSNPAPNSNRERERESAWLYIKFYL